MIIWWLQLFIYHMTRINYPYNQIYIAQHYKLSFFQMCLMLVATKDNY